MDKKKRDRQRVTRQKQKHTEYNNEETERDKHIIQQIPHMRNSKDRKITEINIYLCLLCMYVCMTRTETIIIDQ